MVLKNPPAEGGNGFEKPQLRGGNDSEKLAGMGSLDSENQQLSRGQAALASTFAVHEDRRLRLKGHVAKLQTHELGHAQPAGETEMEHRSIAQAIPAGWLGRIQDRLHFLDRQVADQPRVGFLWWDRQDAPNLVDRRGLTTFEEVHERLDGCQADVSGTWAIGARGFEMMQERDHQRRIDLLQV